jgi:muramidase (phage lysozyme)
MAGDPLSAILLMAMGFQYTFHEFKQHPAGEKGNLPCPNGRCKTAAGQCPTNE